MRFHNRWLIICKRAACQKGAGVLQINGSPTDAAAGLIRDGIHRGLKASGYATLAEFDTPEWGAA
ncbi:ABC-type xylose transport system, periplasmic component [Raoultella planticola]|uniref:ABC-type xylose transport system, periplasmic component n=1 Tax=Raoultella planticola TaxID=575 RepID=A0A485BLT8_RAOPL|nr:ABC-type xylose transport system, periplasmic component [Raoultella planticola]